VLDHDDNVYHLYLPMRYLATHAFAAPVFSLYGAMPHLIEMLYTLPLALGDFVAGKVFAFAIHFWILAGLGGGVRARLGRLGASRLILAAPTTSRSWASSCSGRRSRSTSGGTRGAGPISSSSGSRAAPPAPRNTPRGCTSPC
jgi:hypothetical protein